MDGYDFYNTGVENMGWERPQNAKGGKMQKGGGKGYDGGKGGGGKRPLAGKGKKGGGGGKAKGKGKGGKKGKGKGKGKKKGKGKGKPQRPQREPVPGLLEDGQWPECAVHQLELLNQIKYWNFNYGGVDKLATVEHEQVWITDLEGFDNDEGIEVSLYCDGVHIIDSKYAQTAAYIQEINEEECIWVRKDGTQFAWTPAEKAQLNEVDHPIRTMNLPPPQHLDSVQEQAPKPMSNNPVNAQGAAPGYAPAQPHHNGPQHTGSPSHPHYHQQQPQHHHHHQNPQGHHHQQQQYGNQQQYGGYDPNYQAMGGYYDEYGRQEFGYRPQAC